MSLQRPSTRKMTDTCNLLMNTAVIISAGQSLTLVCHQQHHALAVSVPTSVTLLTSTFVIQ